MKETTVQLDVCIGRDYGWWERSTLETVYKCGRLPH